MLRRARTLALRALLAAVAALGGGDAAGCAYARDRAADLADVLTLEVGAGYGLHADVKATDGLHVGVGYAHLRKAGRGRGEVQGKAQGKRSATHESTVLSTLPSGARRGALDTD